MSQTLGNKQENTDKHTQIKLNKYTQRKYKLTQKQKGKASYTLLNETEVK